MCKKVFPPPSSPQQADERFENLFDSVAIFIGKCHYFKSMITTLYPDQFGPFQHFVASTSDAVYVDLFRTNIGLITIQLLVMGECVRKCTLRNKCTLRY